MGGWKKLSSEEFYNFYPSRNFISITKSRHATGKEEIGKAYILVRQREFFGQKWGDNIKMYIT